MSGKIFINYRRDSSTGMAGRLHDRMAEVFGWKNLCMGLDYISADPDFQSMRAAGCQVFVIVIGPDWLEAKDETGQLLLWRSDDSVAIEISAAITRNIPLLPVLLDGARLPNDNELPAGLKALASREALKVRQLHFDRDTETLIERIREVLYPGWAGRLSWRVKAVAGMSAAAVFLFVAGWISLHNIPAWAPWAYTGEAVNAKAQTEQGAKPNYPKNEQQQVAEQERWARSAAEAQTNLENEEAAKQRVAALTAEQERNRAEAEAQARFSSLIIKGDTDYKAGAYHGAIAAYNDAIQIDATNAHVLVSRGAALKKIGEHDRAISDFNEAIRIDPANALAFTERGEAYTHKHDNDRAIADFAEAIRLNPKSAAALSNRGVAYASKGDIKRAIADFTAALRLDPKSAHAFMNRGEAYANKGDHDRAISDFTAALRLDPKSAFAFSNRGVAYGKKGDYDRAIADFNQAIRLAPKSAHAFRNRGIVYSYKGDDHQAVADLDEAIRLESNNALAFCSRGVAKRNINDVSGNADILKARQLDPSAC